MLCVCGWSDLGWRRGTFVKSRHQTSFPVLHSHGLQSYFLAFGTGLQRCKEDISAVPYACLLSNCSEWRGSEGWRTLIEGVNVTLFPPLIRHGIYDLSFAFSWTHKGTEPPEDWPHSGEIKMQGIYVRYAAELDPVIKNVTATFKAGEKVRPIYS